MVKDLMVAATISLVFGVAALQSRPLPFAGSGGDAIVLLGVGLAVAAGPVYLWRRGRQPIVPIAAIYCVVMLILVFAVDFVIAFRDGRVDL